jgi:hypothetical protein
MDIAAKGLRFRGSLATAETLQAESSHPATTHRLRLSLHPRQSQADTERDTADIHVGHLRALPPDTFAAAAATDRAPAPRCVLGAQVVQRGARRRGVHLQQRQLRVLGPFRGGRAAVQEGRADPRTGGSRAPRGTGDGGTGIRYGSLRVRIFVVVVVVTSCAEPKTLFFFRKTRLQGDLIILGGGPQPTDPENLPDSLPFSVFPQETLLVRYAFSQALSRSTALSALEASLEDYLSSMSSLPLALEKTGKPGMGRRALVKKLGELLRFRQGLNLNRENFFETPDFYWDQPVLEGKRSQSLRVPLTMT